MNKGNIPPITVQDTKSEIYVFSLENAFVDFLGKSKDSNNYATAIVETLQNFTFDSKENINKSNKSGLLDL